MMTVAELRVLVEGERRTHIMWNLDYQEVDRLGQRRTNWYLHERMSNHGQS